jgi:hypothetical protein
VAARDLCRGRVAHRLVEPDRPVPRGVNGVFRLSTGLRDSSFYVTRYRVSESTADIPVDRRQDIFRALVESQDGGLTVVASRAEVARRFSVTEEQVREIEREGLANQWPPL